MWWARVDEPIGIGVGSAASSGVAERTEAPLRHHPAGGRAVLPHRSADRSTCPWPGTDAPVKPEIHKTIGCFQIADEERRTQRLGLTFRGDLAAPQRRFRSRSSYRRPRRMRRSMSYRRTGPGRAPRWGRTRLRSKAPLRSRPSGGSRPVHVFAAAS